MVLFIFWSMLFFFCFKQKTAYELRISDWSSDVCSSDLSPAERREFEDHLADCPHCSAAVAELAGLPGLLSMVPADEVDPVEEVPKELLPRLVTAEIGRASWRARGGKYVEISGGAG